MAASSAHAGELEREFPYRGPIEKVEHRTLTLEQLQSVVSYAETHCQSWCTDNGSLNAEDLTLNHLNDWIIQPATSAHACAFAELCGGRQQSSETSAAPECWHVCHWRGQRASELLSCLRTHLTTRGLAKDTAFWISAFAIRQGSADKLEEVETGALRSLQSAAGMLLVLDELITPLKDLACAYEITTCLHCGKPLDIITGSENVITDGLTVKEDSDETDKYVGAGVRNKADREKNFPLKVVEVGLAAELQHGRTADEQNRLMNAIVEKATDEEPVKVQDFYFKANRQFRALFAASAWLQAVEAGREELLAQLAETLSSDQWRKSLVISLSFCGKVTDDVAKSLADGFANTLNSLFVDLAGCDRLGDDGFRAIAGRLPQSLQSLTLLCWRCEKLSNVSIAALADKIPPQLQTLEINFTSCRKVSEDVIEHLASKLPSSLKRLGFVFPYAQVGDEGIVNIASKLPRSLEHMFLDFSECQGISDKGIQGVAKNLPPSLRSLKINLRGCQNVGDKSIEALAKGLPDGLDSFNMLVKETLVSPERTKSSQNLESMKELANQPSAKCGCQLM